MISYTFSENFDELESKPYLDVYESQNLNHQDYFHHPRFQYACISVFSKNSKCYLLSVYRNEKLIGYAAFRTTNLTIRKINYQFLVPAAFSVAEYNYPIIHKNYIEYFFITFNKALINYNVHFQHVPGFFKKRIIDSIDNSFVSRIIENPILRNLEENFLNISNKSDFVKNKKRLIKNHTIEVNHLDNGVNNMILDSFFEMHINRWKRDRISSNFNLIEYRKIYTKLSSLKIENVGSPVFSYLKVDGEFLAMQYSFITNKRFISQISAFKLNNKTKSAGSILMKEILEHINSIDIEVYDMGVGLEQYKYRFMNDIETYFNILKFKRSISSYISRVHLK